MKYLDESGFNNSWSDDTDDFDYDLDLDLAKPSEALMHRYSEMSLEPIQKDLYSDSSSKPSPLSFLDDELDLSSENDDYYKDLLPVGKNSRFGRAE